MSFPLAPFPVVEGTRFRMSLDADQRGGAEDTLESAVVALRPVQVAVDASGVAGGYPWPRRTSSGSRRSAARTST